jgi:chromosome segregation ATPase
MNRHTRQLRLQRGVLGLLTVFSLSFIPATVWAQTEDAETQAETPRLNLLERLRQSEPQQAAVTPADDARLERIAARCVASQEKLSAHIDRVKASKASHVTVFEKLSLRIENLLPRLTAASVETAELETAYKEFTALVEQLKNDVSAHETLLSSAATMPCAEKPSEYIESLKQLRASHALIAKQYAETKTNARTVLLPALATLKEAIRSSQTPVATPPEEDPATEASSEGSDT